MKKLMLSIVFLSLSIVSIKGQETYTQPDRFIDNVRFGGGINIGLGNTYSTFAISPSAIYDFSNSFSAGLSFTYVYVKTKSVNNRTSNLFGGSALMLFRPIQSLQFSTEFERLKINDKIIFDDAISKWQNALYIGAEYVTGNFAMGLRYDVLFDKAENIIYSSALSPVFRVYF